MKITKSRLLQIIREEVDLHEKYINENTFIFEEEDLQDMSNEEPLPTDKNGNLSKKHKKKVVDDAISGKMEENEVEEDKLFDPVTKKPLDNKKQNDI